jgi:hypothetical protein
VTLPAYTTNKEKKLLSLLTPKCHTLTTDHDDAFGNEYPLSPGHVSLSKNKVFLLATTGVDTENENKTIVYSSVSRYWPIFINVQESSLWSNNFFGGGAKTSKCKDMTNHVDRPADAHKK